MNKRAAVQVGATVESYPRAAWSPLPKDVDIDALWQLVGPQVDMHLQRLPLWKVFCMVYFEGLAHGVGGMSARAIEQFHGIGERSKG